MRAKRGKQYKKLLKKFELHFGFRQPFQVLVDADIVCDSHRFTMDLVPALERTLHGTVKPMITQCSIRHLYARAREPGMAAVIDKAKAFERRRCGHKPEDYPEPLATLECLSHVVDGDGRGENKHRYVVASQDVDVRRRMRAVKGVPLIYISRSVMILEPMADASTAVGLREERRKFRSELRKPEAAGAKRKREADDEDGNEDEDDQDSDDDSDQDQKKEQPKKKKKTYGVKGPNPLSVKKKKKGNEAAPRSRPTTTSEAAASADEPHKKKRKRRGKAKADGAGDQATGTEPTAVIGDGAE